MKLFKFKVFNSYYNTKTRKAVVDIQTPEGIFRGIARAHPDEKVVMAGIGEEIAYGRALINYTKYKIRKNRAILKELNLLYAQSRKFDPTARRIRARIEEYEHEIEALKIFKAATEETNAAIIRGRYRWESDNI